MKSTHNLKLEENDEDDHHRASERRAESCKIIESS